MRRRVLPALAAAVLVASLGACSTKAPTTAEGDPIIVGGTLALTGTFGATGVIHKIAGEVFLDRLNASGGLLGRQVQWRLLDDASNNANIAPYYEQLLTGNDPVDLLMGPYATPNIISAMQVAQQHGYVLPHHTAVLRPALTYSCQFPGWSIGPNPNRFIPEQLFDAVATLPSAPHNIAILTVQNGSAQFVTDGFPQNGDSTGVPTVAAQRGLNVVYNEKYVQGQANWTNLAQAIQATNPDLIIHNSLGTDTRDFLNAAKQLGYEPPLVFSLFPAPGPLVALGADGEGLLAWSMFEANQPALDRLGPQAQEIVAEFEARARSKGVAYTDFETQAAASWTAWEILAEGVRQAGSLDQTKICEALHEHGADTTFAGHISFDPAQNNFWETTVGIKQIQNGEWVMVWPTDQASGTIRQP